MTHKLWKIALVGTGGWARQHARILSLRPDVDFCAVVGRDPHRTATRAGEFGTSPYTQIANLFYATNFNHRYAKPPQLAKQAIDVGRVGDLVFATWRFGGEGDSTHPHANLLSLRFQNGAVGSLVGT